METESPPTFAIVRLDMMSIDYFPARRRAEEHAEALRKKDVDFTAYRLHCGSNRWLLIRPFVREVEESFKEALEELAAVMEKWNLSFDVRMRQEQWDDVVEGIDISQSLLPDKDWGYSSIELNDDLEADDIKAAVRKDSIQPQP